MRFLIVALLAGLATPAVAQSNPAKLLVGNTLTAEYAEGKLVFKAKADGTVSMVTPEGKTLEGRWLVNNEYLCIINPPQKPNDGFPTRCEKIDLASRKLGQSWKQNDSYGQAVTATITKGQ